MTLLTREQPLVQIFSRNTLVRNNEMESILRLLLKKQRCSKGDFGK
jgi:hypothetical protein